LRSPISLAFLQPSRWSARVGPSFVPSRPFLRPHGSLVVALRFRRPRWGSEVLCEDGISLCSCLFDFGFLPVVRKIFSSSSLHPRAQNTAVTSRTPSIETVPAIEAVPPATGEVIDAASLTLRPLYVSSGEPSPFLSGGNVALPRRRPISRVPAAI